jgi:hypothetical protein
MKIKTAFATGSKTEIRPEGVLTLLMLIIMEFVTALMPDPGMETGKARDAGIITNRVKDVAVIPAVVAEKGAVTVADGKDRR